LAGGREPWRIEWTLHRAREAHARGRCRPRPPTQRVHRQARTEGRGRHQKCSLAPNGPHLCRGRAVGMRRR
jgi:hypothetical protein